MYVGNGKSLPGRRKKAQMPKQMLQCWICKSFSKAGQMNACQKEVLGDESYRKEKNS